MSTPDAITWWLNFSSILLSFVRPIKQLYLTSAWPNGAEELFVTTSFRKLYSPTFKLPTLKPPNLYLIYSNSKFKAPNSFQQKLIKHWIHSTIIPERIIPSFPIWRHVSIIIHIIELRRKIWKIIILWFTRIHIFPSRMLSAW